MHPSPLQIGTHIGVEQSPTPFEGWQVSVEKAHRLPIPQSCCFWQRPEPAHAVHW
jgi:hypothetical protein